MAVRLGVQFIDTADSYADGVAEQAVHDALYPYNNLLITTKGEFYHERLGQWRSDARPEHLRRVLDDSLKRLGLETIDLYQLHCPLIPRFPTQCLLARLLTYSAKEKFAMFAFPMLVLEK